MMKERNVVEKRTRGRSGVASRAIDRDVIGTQEMEIGKGKLKVKAVMEDREMVGTRSGLVGT